LRKSEPLVVGFDDIVNPYATPPAQKKAGEISGG